MYTRISEYVVKKLQPDDDDDDALAWQHDGYVCSQDDNKCFVGCILLGKTGYPCEYIK